MADLRFEVSARIGGSGREREGSLRADDHEVGYSVPASMGGKGAGVSPETLLIGAVTACYSLTLLDLLQKRRMPVARIELRAEGVVAVSPDGERFDRITVHPTVVGGDRERHGEYAAAAARAIDRCYIGQTVARGGVAYEVGSVAVAP